MDSVSDGCAVDTDIHGYGSSAGQMGIRRNVYVWWAFRVDSEWSD